MSSPSDIDAELFCGNDDGDPDALYWVTADGRTEAEAIKMTESFVGAFHDGALVSLVTGYVEETSEGPWFHKSVDGPLRMWEVTSR